jgi:hypothetical protein
VSKDFEIVAAYIETVAAYMEPNWLQDESTPNTIEPDSGDHWERPKSPRSASAWRALVALGIVLAVGCALSIVLVPTDPSDVEGSALETAGLWVGFGVGVLLVAAGAIARMLRA